MSIEEETKRLQDRVRQLEEENKKLTINNYTNCNNTYNIVINPYRNTNSDFLTENDYKECIDRMVKEMVKQ